MKLQEVCEVYSGYALKEFHDSDEGYPVIKIGNICLDGTLDLEKCQFTNDSVSEKYFSEKGDIYVALSGATTGKIGIINTDDKYIINQRVGIVRKIDKEIPDQYIKYFLMNKTEKILEDASGCAQPNISPKQIGQYEFPKVDYFEMNQISDIMDIVSNVITQRKLELQELDELIKARFVELFDSTDNRRIFKLNDVCEEITAGGDRPKDTNEIRTEEYPYPVFANAATNDGLLCFSREYKIEKPCVTIAARGCTVGFTAIRNEKFTPVVRLITLVPNETITPIYLKHYIDIKMKIAGNGAAQPQLTIPMIKSMEIMVPPIELQNEYAEFVKQTDKSKIVVQKALDKTQLLFDSLMQIYFGKGDF